MNHVLKDRRKVKPELIQQRSSEMQRAVLVGIRQFAQVPQRVPFDTLPCAKGLFRFDQIDGVLSNALQVLRDATIFESFRILEDRKLVLCWQRWRPTGRQNDELPDDMIESRAEIVDDFSDVNTPHRIRAY